MRWSSACMFAALLYAAPLAVAQWTIEVKADVPFPFSVREMRCAAGEYRISRTAEDPARLAVMRNAGTGESNWLLAIYMDANHPAKAQAKLVFHRYGERYFLREIHEGAGVTMHLPAGDEERQLQVAGAKPAKATVVAWRRQAR